MLCCVGCLENELGLRKFLEDRGHTYVVTDDKEGANSQFEKELPDADVVSAPCKSSSHAPRHSEGWLEKILHDDDKEASPPCIRFKHGVEVLQQSCVLHMLANRRTRLL